MPKCNICGKKVKHLVEHIKRQHPLSEKSIEYLRSLGVPEEKLEKLREGKF